MREWLRDWQTKLAALGIALLAWLYVQADAVFEDQVRVDVRWTLAPDLVAVDALPGAVSVRVRGTRAAIRRAQRADVLLDVDIQDIGAGTHNLDFEPFPLVGLPGGVDVLGHAPSGVRFLLDAVTERKVRVQPNVVGEPAPGFAIEGVDVQPLVANLRGPGAVVNELAEVLTEPIDVSGLAGSASIPVGLSLPRAVESADATRFHAQVTVIALNDERTFASVPVFIWNNPGFRPIEQSVQVLLQGPASALETLDAEEIAAFVHLPDDVDRARYEVAWGPNDGPRLRILHTAGDSVRVRAVEPSRVEVVGR